MYTIHRDIVWDSTETYEAGAVDAGVYVKYRVTGSVYIALVSLGTQDVVASGLFVDPVSK